MTVGIVKVEWNGTGGGPGLTQFAVSAAGGGTWTSSNAQSALDAVRAFMAAQAGFLPNEVSLTFPTTIDQYDHQTGYLTNSVAAPTPLVPVTGSGSSGWAGGVGYRYTWETGTIREGKRVRGRTYIVPAHAGVYEANGTLSGTNVGSMNTSASNFLTALSSAGLQLVVWSRPNTQGDGTGAMIGVTSGTVKDKTAILRSRRD